MCPLVDTNRQYRTNLYFLSFGNTLIFDRLSFRNEICVSIMQNFCQSGDSKRPGREVDPSPPSSAEVKNTVELYLYSP
jgi:hypothetical protein